MSLQIFLFVIGVTRAGGLGDQRLGLYGTVWRGLAGGIVRPPGRGGRDGWAETVKEPAPGMTGWLAFQRDARWVRYAS